jgi:exoribonuclease R
MTIIYRIHEQPKEEKMQRFFDFAAVLGILVKGTKENISPKDLQNIQQPTHSVRSCLLSISLVAYFLATSY